MSKSTVEIVDIRSFAPGVMNCVGCRTRIENDLNAISGVSRIEFVPNSCRISIEYDPEQLKSEWLKDKAEAICRETTEKATHTTFILQGLDCPDCAHEIAKSVGKLQGVLWADANYSLMRLHVEYEAEKVHPTAIVQAVAALGYSAYPETKENLGESITRFPKAMTLAVSGSAILLGLILEHIFSYTTASSVVYLFAMLTAGFTTFKSAMNGLLRRMVTMNALMSLAIIGAVSLGYYSEAAEVAWLFMLGNALQARASAGTRKALEQLLALSPNHARIVQEDGIVEMPAEQLEIGTLFEVLPGDRIPLDGVVVAGSSSLDMSTLTGESLPVDKTVGDEVFAGSLNNDSVLRIKSVKPFNEALLARIIHLVEDAQTRKAPVQQTVDKFAGWYTPLVIVIAAITALAPPLLFNYPFEPWLRRALWLLMVSCPCALIISVPVAVVTALGESVKQGILVKGGAYLEALHGAKAVVFDKTGTLTTAQTVVEEIVPLNGANAEHILRVSASLEASSTHPLAQAVRVKAKQMGISELNAEDIVVERGVGISGRLNGSKVEIKRGAASSDAVLLEQVNRLEKKGNTVSVVYENTLPIGLIVFSDKVRDDAEETVELLKTKYKVHTALISGDNYTATSKIAGMVGIDDYQSELLPEDKLNMVHEYRSQYGKTVMVGDGINDVLALQAADVGIALGAKSSAVAVESADIAIMPNRLSLLPELLNFADATTSVIRQNIAISISTKAVLIVVGLIWGNLSLLLAIAGDVGVSLVVTLNSLRLKWKRSAPHNKACELKERL